MANFESLPKELIAHIATSSDAYSCLQLASTCCTIRAACYDTLVFKEIIKNSQQYQWHKNSLDLTVIEHRCNKNVSAWARYAVADELTIRFAQEQQATLAPEVEKQTSSLWNIPWSFWAPQARAGGSKEVAMLWLPELFIEQHPFMLDGFWRVYLDSPPPTLTAKHLFCLVTAVLAAPGQMLGLERVLGQGRGRRLLSGDTMADYLWGLCWTILQIRSGVSNRLSVWPFNDSARVPHIPHPAVEQIHMQPLSNDYELPLPFSNNFDQWFSKHIDAMAAGEYLTSGKWQGYYIHFGSFTIAARQVDPPMKEIRFAPDDPASSDVKDGLPLIASNCHDGIDTFTIRGTFSKQDDGVVFDGKKRYTHGTVWDWKLRLTPFGLVGYWGTIREQRLHRSGAVWLWKVDDRA
ncbi:hypothetical protein Slin15195_G002160 [Septoria linicola]|uniref:F-box domain-containing protein n=1 Tax=Septoria linicola TaxID=215465 RepID=A0A9Q9ADG9_9PEZI|nr:hypothetical protein Slin14017_G002190 [Septoria linicola]USW46897.1 hypothetical protein Slin15195_G002160 [Septoria linicola]